MPAKGRMVKGAAAGLVRTAAKRPPCCHSRPLFTVIPAPSLPSFPRKRESRTALPYAAAVLASNYRIPAYAGMTVGGWREVR